MSTRRGEKPTHSGRKRPTVRDVARAAGVSPATVSNVLRYPERVTPSKYSAVQEAIQRLDYVPSESARQLRLGQSRTIGLLLLDAWNPSFADMARGVEEVLRQGNWTLLIGNSSRSNIQEDSYLSVFEEREVAGIIFVPNDPSRFEGETRKAVRLPTVSMDAVFPLATFPSVGVDDVFGGEQAMRHLLNLGHRKVVFIGDPDEAAPIRHRLQGVLNVAANYRSEVDFEVLRTSLSFEGGVQAATELITRQEPPTAVVAAIDLIALGAIQRFHNAGIRVPEDLSVCGYDDMGFSATLSPPLTTVKRPHFRMGQHAARILVDLITGDEELQRSQVFAPELVVRASTRSVGEPV